MMKTHSFHGLRASTILVVAIVALALIGCASPLPAPRVAGGTLSISVPHIAAWASQLTKSQPRGSRAYILADSVEVKVQTQQGEDVIPPVLVNWTLGTGYSPAFPNVMSDILDIPAGSNYTVVISIFNHAISNTEPQVRGETTGVTVSDGAVTPVSVTCKPVNPIPLIIDGGYQTETIAPNGERWFVVQLVASQSYYFDSIGPAALFDKDGVIFGRFDIPYTATYTGPVYIGAVDFDGIMNYSAKGKISVQMSTTQPVVSEGSKDSPADLELNQEHYFRLSSSSSLSPYSYYRFTTTEGGNYSFDSKFLDFNYILYSDSEFTSILSQGTSVQFGMELESLGPGTMYYLRLSTSTGYNSSSKGQIVSPTEVANERKDEGTASSPVLLSVGIPHSGVAGSHSFDNKSYYGFSTGTDVHADIKIEVAGASGDLVSLKLYTAPVLSDYGYRSQVSTSTTDHIFTQLSPNTNYYLVVSNTYQPIAADHSSPFTLTVTMNANPPNVAEGSLGTPLVLGLNVDRTFSAGAYESGYKTSYYQFTTTEAGDYAFDIESSSLDTSLYSDAGFSLAVAANYAGYGCEFLGLEASKTYYLKLGNSSGDRILALGRVFDPAMVATKRQNNGTKLSPVEMPLGAIVHGTVGKNSFDSKSYYRFTTGPDVDYTISIPAMDSPWAVLGTLSESSDFSQVIDTYYLSSGFELHQTLKPNTDYYFRAENMRMGDNIAVTFDLRVDAASPPVFSPLSAGDPATTGSILSPRTEVWYEATVVPETTYQVQWTSGTLGATSVSAFNADRTAAYFLNLRTYNSPKSIAIPAGQTKLYLRVGVSGGSSNTGNFTIKLE